MCIRKLRIGYFGDGPWAHKSLKKLLSDDTIDVVFVMARFDSQDPILKNMAEENNIDFIVSPNINADDFLDIWNSYNIDINVSMSFNQIFKKRMIEAPPLRTINCHAGKLPYYRGRNILNWVLINDEKEFGITVHYVDEGIDTGDIILQDTYPITDDDDYGTVLQKAYDGCAKVLYEAIKQVQQGIVVRKPQKDIAPVGMYCGTRKEGDEIIDWNQSSRRIFNFIRAITVPGPCARTFLGEHEIKIIKASMVPEAPSYIGIPGQIIGKEDGEILVKTADTFIKITSVDSIVQLKVGDRLNSSKQGGVED